MILRIGTSGFSYKEWKGSFYPEDLPQSKMLSYYGERFSTVEINNTFYRMPTEKSLSAWTHEVPPSFRFALKAPQRITHQKKLADAGEDAAFLFKAAGALGERLGPVLFQLPPYLKADQDRLSGFLASMPRDPLIAFEFRHASWDDSGTTDILTDHEVAHCIADTDEKPIESMPRATAPWGYLRLRRVEYGDDELARWVRRIADQPWREAYVFFKHEDEGKGPAFAARFSELAAQAGLEV
ncbi:MAG TPA: DUF72 domain-containing protein [Thermoanaerobaculia bacterium]|nr:DUF72 domain-containing protein [Thermoanaerobaculia bacterium]